MNGMNSLWLKKLYHN